mmetsp:Transcript_25727/g.53476  ORF Transcript_25727/g.53476 Transcript_25727/m.53476 type:complete len:223 (-) Transcript_25727:154-822(-)
MSMAMVPSPNSGDQEQGLSAPTVSLGVTRPPSISRLESMLAPTDYSNLVGWPKFKAKVQELFTWWFFAALVSFAISVIVNIEEDENGHVIDDNIKWPYYFNHFLLGLSFFLLNCITYSLCVKFFECEGLWVSALSSSILWYISREVRDREKLGYWDYEGLYAPTLGLVYVFIICQLCSCWYKLRITKETAYVSRYTLVFLGACFVANTVMCIIEAEHFKSWD